MAGTATCSKLTSRRAPSGVFILLTIVVTLLVAVAARKCGIETCHKTQPNKINVHLIAHTHDDVGWLKTVDQYYYGSRKSYTSVGVQYILDSVVSELTKNKDRRFVYVEMAFFWRWWSEQNNSTKQTVYDLVENGQLEFLHGGWCMSDEATPHYSSMIDQMTVGLKFLNETFGECGRPLVAWQIDPFGHSSEVALEFADMGFNGLVVSRIDYEDHTARKKNKQMELVWRPDTTLGESGELFFNVLYDLYTAPQGFCFDSLCEDDPIMDNRALHDYNVDEKVDKFISHVKNYSEVYKTKHIMMTMGGDFTYGSASTWFKNIDKLIKYTNAKSSEINLIYSTPSCYVNAIHSTGTVWPVKDDDDFFPYGSDEHSYWTGYFTSRASLKYLVYKSNVLLQAVKQLATTLDTEAEAEEFLLKRALAISQHHDGVSGTEKQHVANDYALYLHEGINASQTVITKALRKQFGETYPEQILCNLVNVSQCAVSEGNSNFVVTVYNPLARSVNSVVRIPVTTNQTKVYQSTGAEVVVDLIKVPEQVLKIPGRNSSAIYDVVFIASNVPALGATYFYIEQGTGVAPITEVPAVTYDVGKPVPIISNEAVQLKFNQSTGLLQSIIKNGTEWEFQQNFFYYEAMKGYNYNTENRASGAYIFRPAKQEPVPIFATANITTYISKNIIEVHQNFTSWASQIIRLYKGIEDVEFEWLIGPIPVIEWVGKEVITRYTTTLSTNSTFYTDSNGRRWVKRVRNYRKYWNLTITEPVSCNYYPATAATKIADTNKQVTVLIDRPEGVTSMADGQLEIMLHRRLLYDDYKGVNEPLDEIAYGQGLVVRGSHWIQLNTLDSAARKHREKMLQNSRSSVQTFAKTNLSVKDWTSKYQSKFSLISKELPANVHLLTLERWRKDQILIRLEHIYQYKEDSQFSTDQTVDIQNLFPKNVIVQIINELSLAANFIKKDLNRLSWHHEGNNTLPPRNPFQPANGTSVVLQPMQIRTFLLQVKTVENS